VLEPLLSRVVKVGGPVSFTDTGAGVTRVALPRLASVGGSITLRRSKGVGSLCDMPQLRRHMVQGGVTVMDNDNVINLPSDFHEGPGFRSAADVAVGCDAAALAGNARLDAGAGDGLARERVAVTYVRGRRATNESTAAGNATVTEETKAVAADGGALEADTKPQAVNVAEAVPPGTVSIIWVSAGNAAKSGELAECDAEAAAGEDDAGMAGRGNEDDSGGDDGGLSGGAIAGIIIGVLVLICVVVGVVLFILARNDKIDLDFSWFTDACKEKMSACMECGCCKGSGHTISTPARTRGKTGTAARGGTRGAKARTVGRPRPGTLCRPTLPPRRRACCTWRCGVLHPVAALAHAVLNGLLLVVAGCCWLLLVGVGLHVHRRPLGRRAPCQDLQGRRGQQVVRAHKDQEGAQGAQV